MKIRGIVNLVCFSEGKEPTKREALLSEIRQQRKIGNWKHANDLKKHYDRLVKERKI